MKINHRQLITVDPSKPGEEPSALSVNWEKINMDYEKSGLSQKAFCERHHIIFNQFSYQRYRLQRRKKVKKKIAPVVLKDEESFVSHPSSYSRECFILEWSSVKKLTIPTNVNAKALTIILTVLGNASC